MSTRNIRSNYLTDKVTYTSSTMPIGTVIPVFKSDDDKVVDDGVVSAIAQYSINSGSGYTTDIMTPAGFATEPIEFAVNPASTFSVSNDTITYPAISSMLSSGDKVIVKSTAQQPNKAALGGSIESFNITNGGSGYVGTPTVQVGDNGSGPSSAGNFQVAVTGGVVTGINVTDGGQGYQFPTVTISGGGGSNATATATLASNGTGGVLIDEAQEYIVDVTGANTFRLARSAGDISSGYFFNITNLGSSGSIVLITSQGFGLRVGVAAQNTGAIDYTTIKQAGYGYASGDTMKVLQPGSGGDGKIKIQTVSSSTADNPEEQYPGFLYCDGSVYGAADYPLLYEVIKDNYGGTGGSYEKKDFGSTTSITFAVPDYKTRKLVGAGGGVSGGGSPVSGTVISAVGASGGKWYFSKSQQESLIDIGNVVISGYDNVTEFVSASLTGEVTMTVGPLQEKMISAVPEHEHAILTSNAPQAGAMSGAGYFMDNHSAGYKNGTGGVNFFQPAGGVPLFHTHGIVDYIITDPLASTYGNVSGVGTKITKTFTQSAFNTGSDTITITGHGMATGHKLRVLSNPATNPAVFTYAPGNPPAGATINSNFAPNTVWFVVKVDDNTVKISTSKWNALRSNTVDITTAGDAATIVVEVAYNAAGNFPSEPTTTITTPAPTVYDIDNNYVVGGKTITIPGTEFGDTEWFSEYDVGGSYNVPASTSSQEPVEYIVGRITGSGGLGASTDVSGADGLDTYYSATLNGYDYKVIAGGGGGGNDFDELLQTKDWYAIGAGQISAGAAAVWSSFMLNNAIYIDVPSGTSTDPYLGQWVEGGVGINVDAGLAAAGFNVEFHADGSSELNLYNPNGSLKQSNSTPPNTTGGAPQTSSATLVVAANTLTVGWNNLKFKIMNGAAAGSNDWDNNPCGIAFNATRNDTGAVIFNSRTTCTGGTTTKWNLVSGGTGGAGGTARVEVSQGGSIVQTQSIALGDIGNAINLTGGIAINVNNYIVGEPGQNGGSGSTGGAGGASIFVNGAGGDGSRTLFGGTTNAVSEWSQDNNGVAVQYNIPSNYPVSQVTAELKGGGGGSGGLGTGGSSSWSTIYGPGHTSQNYVEVTGVSQGSWSVTYPYNLQISPVRTMAVKTTATSTTWSTPANVTVDIDWDLGTAGAISVSNIHTTNTGWTTVYDNTSDANNYMETTSNAAGLAGSGMMGFHFFYEGQLRAINPYGTNGPGYLNGIWNYWGCYRFKGEGQVSGNVYNITVQRMTFGTYNYSSTKRYDVGDVVFIPGAATHTTASQMSFSSEIQEETFAGGGGTPTYTFYYSGANVGSNANGAAITSGNTRYTMGASVGNDQYQIQVEQLQTSGAWYAGDGGDGKHVVAAINAGAGQTLNIWVGGGGTSGSGLSGGIGGKGFSDGGNGGSGTGGGGGGGGGGSSAIGIGSGPLIGAGGGGGGGAAGDGTQLSSMNGQPNPNNDSFQLVNGCFAGSGGQGNNSVCTGGGGGGGGGGVGSGVGIGGGGGAGNGSNAVKPGFGATRGQSSLVTGQSIISEGDANNGGDVNIGQEIDGTDGYVKLTTQQNTTEYGPGGGGGGSGCHLDFMLDNLSTSSVNAGTLNIGNGNDDGDGRIGYGVITSSNPGTGTSSTVGLFDAASGGVDYVNSGTGTGSNGGFTSPDAQKYLRFRGTEQIRWARTITYNASGSNSAGTVTESVRFEVIRGNDSNGGESPTAPLELFGSNDGGGSYIKFGTISTNGGATTWESVDVNIPATYRVSNLLMEVRQSRSASGNEELDNYGIAKVSMIHAEGEVTTYTTQAGRLDLGVESIQEVIAPQGDPVNSAGITVNDGKFTLSSAVKLNVTPSLQPEVDIPLVTRYHLVKYMIRAY